MGGAPLAQEEQLQLISSIFAASFASSCLYGREEEIDVFEKKSNKLI